MQPRGGEPDWPTAFDWAAPWSPFAQMRMLAPLARQMDELMSSTRALAPAISVARTAVDVRETLEAFEFIADVRIAFARAPACAFLAWPDLRLPCARLVGTP